MSGLRSMRLRETNDAHPGDCGGFFYWRYIMSKETCIITSEEARKIIAGLETMFALFQEVTPKGDPRVQAFLAAKESIHRILSEAVQRKKG
jgi:hypothetical protein